MLVLSELNEIFLELISLASKVPIDKIILADQGKPTQNFGLATYATYKPIPIRAYGQVHYKREEIAPIEEYDPALGDKWTDLKETACTSMEIMLSVNFFNDGAEQAAMMLQNANFRNPISDYLFSKDIAWRYTSNPRNLSAIFQAGIQQRWQTDIQLFVEHTVSYDVLRAANFQVILERS